VSYLTQQFNRFMADDDAQDAAYELWVEQQDEEADTSWAAFQADCQASYHQALEDEAAWRASL
jgi:hypothetical protein